MARVTVEDCIKKVQNNRFALVALAAERVKHIRSGAPITVAGFNPQKDKNKEKDTVIALREIAAGNINPEILYEQLVSSLQSINKIDNIEEENMHISTKDELNQDFENKDLYDITSNEEILPENSDMLFNDDSQDEQELNDIDINDIISQEDDE